MRRLLSRLGPWRISGGLLLAALAGYALFAGWWQYSQSLLPLRERVETPAGTFTLAASPRVARTEAGGTALGRHVYLVGGIGPFLGSHSSVERYDTATGQWQSLPDLPRPINHPGVVAADGKIWVIGGFGPIGIRLRGFMFARWDPLDTVFVFDPEAGVWTNGPPLPAPRGAGGVAAAAGALWYVGGINSDRALAAELFRFDLASRSWQVMAPMATPRDHLRLEAVSERLFAISGRRDDLRFNLPVVERYDISSGSWARVADSPSARGGFGSTVLDGKIYTFGGELVWSTLAAVERYDPAADRWEELGPLPESRHGICAATIDGRIHLVSGGRHPRVSVSRIHRVLEPRR